MIVYVCAYKIIWILFIHTFSGKSTSLQTLTTTHCRICANALLQIVHNNLILIKRGRDCFLEFNIKKSVYYLQDACVLTAKRWQKGGICAAHILLEMNEALRENCNHAHGKIILQVATRVLFQEARYEIAFEHVKEFGAARVNVR